MALRMARQHGIAQRANVTLEVVQEAPRFFLSKTGGNRKPTANKTW